MTLLQRIRRSELQVLLFLFYILSDRAIFSQSTYLEMHQQALVVDLHNDALYRHINGQNIESYHKYGQFDLIKMQQGGIDVQFFALWPDPAKKETIGMFEQTKTVLDSFYAIIGRNSELLQIARSADEIDLILRTGKRAACLGVEGGTAIENNLKLLEYFYERGCRYLGLTWNDSPAWASSAKDETDPHWPGEQGLSDFGKIVVGKLNELGMMIDLAHAGEKTFYDVMRITKKPVIVSHSAVYSLCPHFRNLKDAQLKALAQNGGVIFINFYPGFLVKNFDEIYSRARKEADIIQDSLKSAGDSRRFDRATFIHQKIQPLYPDLNAVVDHIQYVIHLVGEDHVGLGSDFCGISIPPAGLEDVSKMPAITKELLRRGYGQETIKKILGENFMRVFKAVSKH